MSEQISKKISFFPFQWCYDQGKNDDNFTIRVYGWNRKNENVCCIIDDFSIPIWIELDDTIEWTEGKISLMKNKLRSLVSCINRLQKTTKVIFCRRSKIRNK